MSLDPSSISVIMKANLASNTIIGISSSQLALGIANGLSLYAISGMNAISVDVGTLGAGTGIGFGIILPTPVLLTSMFSAFSGFGIVGVSASLIVNAISIGFTQSFALASINTVNPIVGIGSGVITITPNPEISSVSFVSGFISAGIVGVSSAQLATAISVGLDAALPSAKGVVAIVGSPSTIPSAGGGFGKVS